MKFPSVDTSDTPEFRESRLAISKSIEDLLNGFPADKSYPAFTSNLSPLFNLEVDDGLRVKPVAF
jgi:hypothetical protein